MIAAILAYAIATLGFAGATANAYHNYRRTKGISNYWLIFAIAMGLGTLFSAMDLLQHSGVAPILDEVDRWIALMFLFALIMTAVETLTSNIDVTIE